ncbi:chondroadherin-like [Pararge aegeria]|uniref:Jg16011 protein n=1 Tax=Pararge aegeria aegeria TaxID=348720 RepID=A0A8S4SPG1_9NEOP|nr:chondroadherin-like [Pararge aegeria]XP_039754149.1 chondroadherin-like [Pararge aegeria]CAH2268987.1 jg16011 [Pararge aegeria aegeria]
MCFLRDIPGVLVILCVLVSASHALGEVINGPCDIFFQDVNNLTLNCSRRNIDRIPNWPEAMKNVSNQDGHVLITFFNNSITNVTELPPVPGNRVAISFKSNKIIEINDDAFNNVHRLVYLDLSNNRLSGDVLRSEIFQGPYKDGVYKSIALETLNLGNNRIHSLDRYLFQYTPNLTRLYLNNNPIEILDHVTILALFSATKLEVLDLAKTDIDSIPLDAFRGLVNLRQIDLSGNKFVTVPESLGLVGTSLQYLTFNNNPIVELNDDSFIGLTNLVELEVGENNYLEEVKRSTFTPLKSLRVLHLCHNRNLRYISHNAFRGIKDKWTLKEVYLDDNNLSELSTDLLPWNKLEVLGMTGNNWLCNCDLANIVTNQEAGTKFKAGEIPYCAAPMRLNGAYITNITASFCPTLDTTFAAKKGFSINLKPKHILWSILGVAAVVGIGMICGLLVNTIKAVYKKNTRSQPIRYFNINDDTNFA